MIAVKHATMLSVLLFAAKTVHSHAAATAMGRGISRRERILKSPSWDPAGCNKDLHGCYRISFRVSERGEEELQRATKNPTRLQQQVVRSGYSIHPVLLPAAFDPGFRIYAVTFLPSIIAPPSDIHGDSERTSYACKIT